LFFIIINILAKLIGFLCGQKKTLKGLYGILMTVPLMRGDANADVRRCPHSRGTVKFWA